MQNKSIPVHLLTGFLGAGKTTLLNRLLKREEYSDTLVIVNEFGSTPIDHHLIENSSETILELSNGCLCCSIRGELTETLLSVDASAFSRIIIETTGIADPLPVFQSLCLDEIARRGLRPGAIMTVIDAKRGSALVKSHEEAEKQLALADVVFASHTDNAPIPQEIKQLALQLSPGVTVTDRISGIDLDGLEINTKRPAKPGSHSHYNSLVLETEAPHPLPVFVGFFHHLASQLGERLLRAKGFGFCHGETRPVLFQMTGQLLHEPVPLETWPQAKPATSLVVIGKNIDNSHIRKLFSGHFSIADIDTPDRNALVENPLAISGTISGQLPFSTRKT